MSQVTELNQFTELNLPDEIVTSLQRNNIHSPTDIQKQAIPLALEGHDILASSKTGSGKTLAYLLPIISLILEKGGRALILTPTRELTLQVCATLSLLFKKIDASAVAIIGGDSFFKQSSKLKSNPEIVVGTAGRLIDHLTRRTLKLAGFRYFVLDEMDSMLDLGMKKQIDQIINQFLPKERQTFMFSATIPPNILELSMKYMQDPKRVTIGSATKPAPEIAQEFLRMPESRKYEELDEQLLAKEGTAIVFVKTKRGADRLTGRLRISGHRTDVIHGGLTQNKRSKVIADFRAEKTRVLVATDIAARGLDIDHVKYVFNYDLPNCAEDYLHRIGRTGRAGAEGFAISFVVSPNDNNIMRAIDKLIQKGESSPREPFRKKGNGDSNFRQGFKKGFRGGSRSSDSRGDSRSDSGYRPDSGYRADSDSNRDGQRKKFAKKTGGHKFGAKTGGAKTGEGFFAKKNNKSRHRSRAA